MEFAELAEVEDVDDGVICRPKAPNLAIIDFLIQPDKVVQITANDSHGFKAEGYRDAYEVMKAAKNGNPVYFDWWVTPHIFQVLQESDSSEGHSGCQEVSFASAGLQSTLEDGSKGRLCLGLMRDTLAIIESPKRLRTQRRIDGRVILPQGRARCRV